MVNSFAVKTGGKEIDDIHTETKRILEEMDLINN